MKIQCSCGAKYELELLPEMAHQPIRFLCTACGLDSSEFVNQLIRRELAAAPAAAAATPAPAAALRLEKTAEPVSSPVPAEQGPPEETLCPKHPGEVAVAKCYMCSKPICPKCMELFGYVCSPLCRAKAGSHGIELPVYAGQKSVAEARFWRRVTQIGTAAGVLVLGLIGFWIWWAWVGCLPKPVFSVRFPEAAESGQSFFCGVNQIVFLHGDTLARHDLKSRKEVWSRQLVDHNEIQKKAEAELRDWEVTAAKAREDGFRAPKIPSKQSLVRELEREAAAELVLRVQGQNVWVASPTKLVHYEWDTGKPEKEIPRPPGYGNLVSVGPEWLLIANEPSLTTVTHVDLASAETRVETVGGSKPASTNTLASKAGSGSHGPRGVASNGLPGTGTDSRKPLDPAKVAEQAQNLSYPARLALPATLSVGLNQERAMREMDDETAPAALPVAPTQAPGETGSLIPTTDGLVQVSVKLLESRLVRRSAMKAAPAKSALDGNLTVTKTTDVANEILNEMQRDRGGDVVVDDESRYQVTLRRPSETEGWTGEVVGPPSFFPLEHVNVLTANKSLCVFDKANKLLWRASLSYNVQGGLGALDADNAPYGRGPCVEHKDALYVIDAGVLTAFERATGNARWRVPSVGIEGLFFDEHDMLYVNSTTASHESLKYSRQIDISEKVGTIVLKIDAKTGRTLWTAETRGLVNYVEGKYIFIARMNTPPPRDEDEDAPDDSRSNPAFVRITRLNPRNGQPMWEHFEQRGPLDVQFAKNSIRLVFKKEVEVLHFP